ncbi:MAG: N-6 DNA methylase [Planctomycetes bacterium]|nr:N-6 DNA methylase [Planctomycetota bacterium]
MSALPSNLRNKLESTVVKARDIAVEAARAALDHLGVFHHEPYPQQSPEQRHLRARLRAHARQLGDAQNTKGDMAPTRLIQECAYEHWHRMLFARFLAENNLLIEPESQIPINLTEAEELAKHVKTDTWTYASRCAQQMLPAIFRPDDPVLQVNFATEHRVALERLVNDLAADIFKADDSLGWVYQFWQSAERHNVNKAGEKITGDTLPAVTQLFTEHYMVLFLLHNTIGAWWAGKKLTTEDTETTETENGLRRKLALPGVDWEYLRFVRGPDGNGGPWRPAAGMFPGWPQRAADLKLLDPCCGSGHFLVAGFELLVRLRMAEEGLSLPAAVDAVILDNIFGLELDPRCTQIAVFNLALAAWKLTGYRDDLPSPHVAPTGLSVGGTRDQWLRILEGQGNLELRFFFGQLYDLFRKAHTLGSLINPHRFLGSGMLDKQGMDTLLRHLQIAIADDPRATPEKHELGIAAQGLAKAAELLAEQYTLVVTNVPYLGRAKQDTILREHLETQYPLGKADLATAFVLRCLEFCSKDGSAALVTPQNWLFLTTYTKLRETLLDRREWNIVARLGPGAFETISGHVVNVTLFALSATTPDDAHLMAGIDVSAAKQPDGKAALLCGDQPTEIILVSQAEQLKNPDARIQYATTGDQATLAAFADSYQGIGTSDNAQFLLCFWEQVTVSGGYRYVQVAPDHAALVSGATHILHWEEGTGRYYEHAMRLKSEKRLGGWKSGGEAWGKDGVAVSVTGDPAFSRYLGTMFDTTMAAIIPKSPDYLPAIETFVRSDGYIGLVRTADQALSLTEHSFLKVPFDIAHWQQIAAERYPDGLPEPESDDPTQWLFHGRPEASNIPLQVAVTRLLGYQWPAEIDEQMRLSQRARELVKRCDELLQYADDDGIVCIPSVRGEEPAADRLLTLLSSCGAKPDRNLDEWLRDEYFQEHCELFHHRPFIWHIWDGRKRDGFHALVNYHRLVQGGGKGRKVLESLTYSYLGEWVSRQQDGVKRGDDGADDRLAAAIELQKRLVAILEGEPPFDLFVRWKPLAEQAIGWEPDINDGVRVNIRPFLCTDLPPGLVKDGPLASGRVGAELPNGKTGAGVLRWKPNIKWEKDRGKEPKRPIHEYPWFWGWDGSVNYTGGPLAEFTGERHNDCHYTTEFKRQARRQARGKP